MKKKKVKKKNSDNDFYSKIEMKIVMEMELNYNNVIMKMNHYPRCPSILFIVTLNCFFSTIFIETFPIVT